jgi:mannosyl-3-phosphoglycerate phosphatase family protein
MTKTIIFTDLDGTLLHPKTYSFEDAAPALGVIIERDIPLILCSSKTRAEMEVYRTRLKNKHPFIVENGGAVYVPTGYFTFPTGSVRDRSYIVTEFGAPYKEIRKNFASLRESLGVSVKGFGDMSVEEISEVTGLSSDEAALAREREYGEPFIFEQRPDDRFLQAIEERGLRWTQGRLYCLMGDHDKGKAIRLLKSWFQAEYGKLMTIGLGDGLNDLPLLSEVDRPVLIPKEDGSYDPRIELPGLRKAKGTGPVGWNRAVLELLKE